MNHLVLTVRFLDDRYHGLLDRGGPPEWPPSPFRLFQALVAGVARRGELVVGDDVPANLNFTAVGEALCWLQRYTREHPPTIIAPKSKTGQAITRFVPNNDGDKKFDRQERLTAKPTIPTLFLLESDQKPEVHYVWDVASKNDCPVTDIERAARSLTTLGWGIDMAFADVRLADARELNKLFEREEMCSCEPPEPKKRKWVVWYPKKRDWPFHDTLRTPTYDDELGECTLSDLRHCHSALINRIEHGKPLKTVDKPKVFDRILYTSIERQVERPHAVFKLVDENDDTVAYSNARLKEIAGMVRHLAIETMKLNPPPDVFGEKSADWIRAYVAGHQSPDERSAGLPHSQFSYVPLPSTGHEHADPAIRRVMLVAPLGGEAFLEHLAHRLDGRLLKPLPGTMLPPGTRLQLIPESRTDGVRDAYTRPSRGWASFTPVVLPRHDDHKPAKTRRLIEKALAQSGIEQPCRFEWSAFSRFPKSYSAHKYVRDEIAPQGKRLIGYLRPDHLLHQTAVHVQLGFDHPVPGPLTIGAGRHCGFGLMAAINDL
jgi:CRISPR-associated protein Csb2